MLKKEKPIRILHMIGSLNVGGSQSVVLNLYKNIDRSRFQFDFVIDHPGQTELLEEVVKLGGKVYHAPTFKGTNLVSVLKFWNNFFSNHKEYRILHSHVRSYASIFFFIAHIHSIKTIIHSHSTSNGEGLLAILKNALQYPLRFQADYFIACSKEAGAWLFGNTIISSPYYHILQNAIDIRKYEYDPYVREKYRRELNVNGKRVFIHVGRLTEAKNHFYLLNVFHKYLQNYNNSILLIVGDGELRNQIKNTIDDLGLHNNVKMLGTRSDVAQLLQASDCFLFPSKWEGLPVTVVEAQASGIPCLVSSNVTNDVFITNLAIKLNIDQGIDCWVDKMKNLSYERLDVKKSIIDAGFDIKCTVEWLEDLYWRMYND